MAKESVKDRIQGFLSDSYEEDLCTEIIRNAILGLRKSPKKLQPLAVKFKLKRESESNLVRGLKIRRIGSKVEGDFQRSTIRRIDTNSKEKVTLTEVEVEDLKSIRNHEQDAVQDGILVGSLVWAQLYFCESWPAVIVDAEMCGRARSGPGKCWVFWFGDHKVSEVLRTRIFDFCSNFERFYNRTSRKKTYVGGINEALQECWKRTNESVGEAEQSSLLQWSLSGFAGGNKSRDQLHADSHVPQWISLILKRYAEEMRTICVGETDCGERNTDGVYDLPLNSNSDGICISCKCCAGLVDHPFFNRQLCYSCKDKLHNSLFIFDVDGFNMFCIICSQAGELFLCEKPGCNKVYCRKCLLFFTGEDGVERIRRQTSWSCFLCSPCGVNELEAFSDWKLRLALMFQPEPIIIPTKKVCLRVLSLFDGISTGKVVLDQLNIKVEAYYASEIDQDSLLVSKMRHSGGAVEWIGSVESISSDKLQELGPIDLLIGGSPCNEFSVANPSRKGLDEDGTGVLFYEFYRILVGLREIQTPGRPLFWLFENVASMQKHCRSTISRFFNCFPALLDAKYFSAHKRPRLFWGNIPGMYCPPQYNTQLISATKLKETLFPTRNSQFEKIKTVTTKLNSLFQNGGNELPVIMDSGEETLLWIPELERIFGFPDHYTDVGDLSRNRRQKLIGQAWSVHVVKHLLSPLEEYFERAHS